MKYGVSHHAIVRWQERVRPTLDRDGAKADLLRVLHGVTAEPVSECPWPRESHHDCDAFLEICDGVLAVLEARSGRGKWAVVTILTRSGFSEERRARKNANKARKRAARRARNRRSGRTGHDRSPA